MGSLILAIDEGTTNVKACLVDRRGRVVCARSRELGLTYPAPAWVEQDAREIWEATREVAAALLASVDPREIAAIGISNQRESVLTWDRATGEPLGPCITWQCHRTAAVCESLRARGVAPLVIERTGLTIDPMFSATKARWLLEHASDGLLRAEAGEICVGTVDAWLLWNLTGGQAFCCDVTNASRTQLFSLQTQSWDPELLRLFGIPAACLPEVRLSSALYGETVQASGLPTGLPIGALIGDSHAALFGHVGFVPGMIKATYGTGSSLMTPTPERVHSERGLSASVAWGHQEVMYALEGNIYVTGAAVQWLAEVLRVEGPGAVEELAAADNGGVYFVPALVGLGAPHWREDARGLICGLTRGTTGAQIARATLESVGYQVRDVFELMQREAGAPLTVLLADGGATRNRALMQFQADVLGVPVLASLEGDVSAVGAAYLAGLTVGMWASREELQALERPQRRYEPAMDTSQRDALYAGWQDAMARTLYRPGAA